MAGIWDFHDCRSDVPFFETVFLGRAGQPAVIGKRDGETSLAFGCFYWDPHGAVNDNPSVAHELQVQPLLAPVPIHELQLRNGPLIRIDGEAQIGVVDNGRGVLVQVGGADASLEFVCLARFDAAVKRSGCLSMIRNGPPKWITGASCGRSAKRRL